MKKPTRGQLEARIARQAEYLNRLQMEMAALRVQHAAKVDQTMIESRIKLANALGQMMHATTEAVKWIIAKECA